MTLIEAIKSGRPFKRVKDTFWCSDPESIELRHVDGGGSTLIKRQQILADDWEIQEPKVEITRAHVVEAIHHAVQYFRLYPPTPEVWVKDMRAMSWDMFTGRVLESLGLGDTEGR